jgi:hypothetical protein
MGWVPTKCKINNLGLGLAAPGIYCDIAVDFEMSKGHCPPAIWDRDVPQNP